MSDTLDAADAVAVVAAVGVGVGFVAGQWSG